MIYKNKKERRRTLKTRQKRRYIFRDGAVQNDAPNAARRDSSLLRLSIWDSLRADRRVRVRHVLPLSMRSRWRRIQQPLLCRRGVRAGLSDREGYALLRRVLRCHRNAPPLSTLLPLKRFMRRRPSGCHRCGVPRKRLD